MRIGIEAEHDDVRDKFRDLFVRVVRLKNLVVDPGEMVLPKTANRIRRPQHRLANPVLVKRHERPIAFLHLDNAILNGHALPLPKHRNHNITSRRSTITLTPALSICYLRVTGHFSGRIQETNK